MTDTPYEDHLLGARDVCSNCLRLIRVERLDPTRNGFGHELEETYERRRETTEVAYGPSDAVSESKGVFCACGVESARERIWQAPDIDRERFKALLKHALRTLALKDVTLKRKEAAAYALQAFDDGAGPDAAIAEGVESGVVAAVASERPAQPAD